MLGDALSEGQPFNRGLGSEKYDVTRPREQRKMYADEKPKILKILF